MGTGITTEVEVFETGEWD